MTISGPQEPSHREEIQLYKQEYKHGVDLFQRALTEYKAADEIHKKDAFRQVMDRALQVLNETAQGMKRSDLLQQNQKIAQDLHAYEQNPTPTMEGALAKDLSRAQKLL